MNTRIISKEDVKIIKGTQYVPWIKTSLARKPPSSPLSSPNPITPSQPQTQTQKVIELDLDEKLG